MKDTNWKPFISVNLVEHDKAKLDFCLTLTSGVTHKVSEGHAVEIENSLGIMVVRPRPDSAMAEDTLYISLKNIESIQSREQ